MHLFKQQTGISHRAAASSIKKQPVPIPPKRIGFMKK